MVKNIGEYEVEAIHLRREIRRQNDKIERLRREGNGSMWEQENRGLRLENEQLREKYKKEREHSTDLGNKIDELLTRIEELEKDNREMLADWVADKPGRTVLTPEQIDAAWTAAFNLEGQADKCCQMEMERAFRQLGIVRCEGCGGVGDREPYGMYQPNGDPTDPTWVKCPDCDGHGWVIGGEDA
jgi:hypothetical protein